MRRIHTIVASGLIVLFVVVPPVLASGPEPGNRITPRAQSALGASNPSDRVTVVVTMADQADLTKVTGNNRAATRRSLISLLQATAGGQASLRGRLAVLAARGMVEDVTSFWIFNGLSVTASPVVIAELGTRSDVAIVDLESEVGLATTEPNLTQVGAQSLWASGLDGTGMVVAALDTGVDVTHPDLQASWRGGTNSWFDPYNGTTSPNDPNGHGTGTMSIMVGGAAGGTSIGVAPGAKWIAAKIFNNSGGATSIAIHSAFQWLLDPDSNPATDDAPDVVNNSWTMVNPGCDLAYQNDINALRTAGILPVFAAGNSGTGGSLSPGNNPGAFSVGAVDGNDTVLASSSRGPSACTGDTVYPDLVAPGSSIRVARPGNTYMARTGTSMAAPHVTAGLALLLQARPGLGIAQQEAALVGGAVDLGQPGLDLDSGFGRLDLVASLAAVDTPVNQAPVAAFTTEKRKSTYSFNASGSSDPDGVILSYRWDFGDGSVGSGPVVSHVFGAGTFTVTLRVTDDDGAVGIASTTLTHVVKGRR
jgi:subtilisin family serine protease